MTLIPQGVLAVDATFLSTAPRDNAATKDAVPYDSEYAAAARKLGTAQDTPEADARPGEYYFLRGARAFQKKDYEFAIQMYEVAASWAFKPAEYNLAVMYARSQGVPADLPRGMAWMALAAAASSSPSCRFRSVSFDE
jgi:TPR repeat protein